MCNWIHDNSVYYLKNMRGIVLLYATDVGAYDVVAAYDDVGACEVVGLVGLVGLYGVGAPSIGIYSFRVSTTTRGRKMC